ncbi:hypothetical protein O181_022165 [Austropuccinia psidii MF-1]|uniref:Uncharacterized protein n=1 Tax=Austropuccinia psidii MF-1 TaxID=1389203 RepID=A0A9Q3CFZ3_9BASI|nr:hypothetical protein [Austropuccinia psidii MF-1]
MSSVGTNAGKSSKKPKIRYRPVGPRQPGYNFTERATQIFGIYLLNFQFKTNFGLQPKSWANVALPPSCYREFTDFFEAKLSTYLPGSKIGFGKFSSNKEFDSFQLSNLMTHAQL